MADAAPLGLLATLAGPADALAERIATATEQHPALADVIAPVAELLVGADTELVLRLRRNDTEALVRGLYGPAALVLEHAVADSARWQVEPLMSAPRIIAGIVDLGPQPTHGYEGTLLPMPTDALAVACGVSGGEGVVDPLVDAMEADGLPRAPLEAILSPTALFWQLGLYDRDDEQPAQALAAIETEHYGLWLAHDAPGGALLQSVPAAGAWRALCDTLALLPAAPSEV